jgi:hypothetical protein
MIRSLCIGPSLVLAALTFGCSSNATTEASDASTKPDTTTDGTDAGVPFTSFDEFYSGVIVAYKCLECHVPGKMGVSYKDDAGVMVAGGELDMSTKELAFENLVNKKAAGVECGDSGLTRVIPNNAADSLIVQKTELAYTESEVAKGLLTKPIPPPCGAEMPKGCTQPAKAGGLACLFTGDIRTLTDWINSGAPGPDAGS